MSTSKNRNINYNNNNNNSNSILSFEQILKQNCDCCISEISIIHRTGRPRIIFRNGNVYDIGFERLIRAVDENKKVFCDDLLIKYCKFSKKQIDRLIENIPYRINSRRFKDSAFGFSELYLSYAKDKHLKTVTLLQ